MRVIRIRNINDNYSNYNQLVDRIVGLLGHNCGANCHNWTDRKLIQRQLNIENAMEKSELDQSDQL